MRKQTTGITEHEIIRKKKHHNIVELKKKVIEI